MWRQIIKNKGFLFGICVQLLFLTAFSMGTSVKAAVQASDGFIIQADRVVGSGMSATIIRQETSSSSGKPMLRFQYKSATIYGMRLTKKIQTENGPISISLKASGPVTVKGMTVDTSAITFQGACIKALMPEPEAGMNNVVMVAHYMNSVDSNIDQLKLETVSGSVGPDKPDTVKILKELAGLPANQIDSEIKNINSSHLPLTCDDPAKEGSIGDTAKLDQDLKKAIDIADVITNPVQGTIGAITQPLVPVTDFIGEVTKPLEPVTDTIGEVTKPLKPVTDTIGEVTKPLKPVTDTIGEVTKPLKPVTDTIGEVTKPLDPVKDKVNDTVKKLDPVVKPVTDKVGETAAKLDPVTKPISKTAEKVTLPVQETVKPVVQTTTQTTQKVVTTTVQTAQQKIDATCSQISSSGGQITKENALTLINGAIANKKTLEDMCSTTSLKDTIKKWDDSLLKSLGLLNIFGKKLLSDPMKELEKMREQISSQKDGTIIYKP
ncbi:hypothetical protein [Neobacillus terrae]|uniref:hypothetical protein n=1 Tax=Neobacillus terrae TaxID=3034837 RepID=UPI00140941F7|nr:hypothetical protein [Neobacillus terrae]NHM31510.1 hypothetical protein [Neobacillus terrae]